MTETIFLEGRSEELLIDREAVFRMVKCSAKDPLYEEYLKEYDELQAEALPLLHPKAALGFSFYPEGLTGALKPGDEIIYMILTIGPDLSALADGYLKSGDYVKGLLADALATEALFAFEKPVLREIRKICRRKGVGIKKRLEAPYHIPMEIQRIACDELNAGELLGISVSAGLMYDPVKSSCQVFAVTENPRVLNLAHSCGDCSYEDCSHRRKSAKVIVRDKEGDYEFTVEPGSNLLMVLTDNGVMVSAPCGGKGRCGKCAVRILSGDLQATAADERIFSKKELSQGKRLACMAVIENDLTVELLNEREEEMAALNGEETGDYPSPENSVSGLHQDKADIDHEDRTDAFYRNEEKDPDKVKDGFGLAIDIGTTTLALCLVDLPGGKVRKTYTAVNRQRRYGADVISRIEAACNGKARELRESIRDDLAGGINALLSSDPVSGENLKETVIAGNTTMLHLLLGYPVEGLGVFPFTAHSLSLEKRSFSEVFGDMGKFSGTPVYILPGCSAFAGADIVSGMFSLDFHENGKVCALIDLGTNGEMAVGNREKLLVTSTAAGPAFEGGNITYGSGSVAGAISDVTIRDTGVEIKTIGDKTPSGICGTGVISVTAELLKNGLVDKTGMLGDAYFERGFPLAERADGEMIRFTQKDIREIQLAKSAVRAGFEVLLKRFGIDRNGLYRLYIAGGFGYYLNPTKAAAIGLIPEELLDRTEAAGNSSLNGAIRFMTALDDRESVMYKLARQCREVVLATDRDFNDLYMENMMF
ncbi:MAG: ASKHA domain-containing protein [Lachnospiraceae bacterium]|nr:ASKHA domain-containing protein [Lachnospiraceae bacterium]